MALDKNSPRVAPGEADASGSATAGGRRPHERTTEGLPDRRLFDLNGAFNRLVTPALVPTGVDVRPSLPDKAEARQRRQSESAWPTQSRRSRRASAYLTLGKLTSGATVLAALEFGSTLGQAIGAAVYGGIELLLGGPDVLKTLRETRKQPPVLRDTGDDDAMTIDLATEETLRKVLFSALKGDHGSFEQGLEAFDDKTSLLAACARATDLSALMILDQCKGRPSTGAVNDIANHAAEHNAWSSIGADEFERYLNAIFAATPVDQVLDLGTALRIPFVLCAHLLLSWHDPQEQAHEYLDRLWETLENGHPQS